MRTVHDYKDVPDNAAYLGGEDGGGYLDESTADIIDRCFSLICLIDDGIKHYFTLDK
jgi:hypothetical protein